LPKKRSSALNELKRGIDVVVLLDGSFVDIDEGLQDSLLFSSGDIVAAAALQRRRENPSRTREREAALQAELMRRDEQGRSRVVSGKVPRDSSQT